MLNILLTGVATLDIINQVDRYPTEDSEVRALDQQHRLGGNAANSACVVQQLGSQACLLAMRADDNHAEQVFSQLNQAGVNTEYCPIQADSTTPISYITLSRESGTRSIVHYRKLDELDASALDGVELKHFDWLHFEARNCLALKLMLEQAQQVPAPVSLELEKPREHLQPLLDYADVLLISRPFAEAEGYTSATQCLQAYAERYKDKLISCTWGGQGAWLAERGQLIHQPAFVVDTPVETLGAGDTYNAALISRLAMGDATADALAFACRLAAKKCTQFGFDHLLD